MNRHLNRGTDTELTSTIHTDQAMTFLFVLIEIVLQAGDMNQPFNIDFMQFDKEAEGVHRGYHARKFFAYFICNKLTFFQLDDVPFSLHCPSLRN